MLTPLYLNLFNVSVNKRTSTMYGYPIHFTDFSRQVLSALTLHLSSYTEVSGKQLGYSTWRFTCIVHNLDSKHVSRHPRFFVVSCI